MRIDHEPESTALRPRRPLLPLLLLPLLAFVAGIAAMGWMLTNWNGAARMIGIVPEAPRAAPAPMPPIDYQTETLPVAPGTGAPQETQRLVIDPEMTRRVNRLEERLGQIDLQSRAAVGNADRAEGLLVAFAARRALDRGVQLGYLETLLRERFGTSQPQAVATVLTAARQPVTLAELQKDLQEAGPHLSGGGQNQSWWTAFKTELAGLARIRREGTPSPMPAERLRRASQSLDAGQVDIALLEVLRMPGRDMAEAWVAKARRYVAARRALDTLETAALLEPRSSIAVPVGVRSAAARPAAGR
jgi:hypothetical protein